MLVTVLLYGAAAGMALIGFVAAGVLVGCLIGLGLRMLPQMEAGDVDEHKTCAERELAKHWRDQLTELRGLPTVRR